MKGFLQVVLCAGVIGLFTAGCGGGTETPPTGSSSDPKAVVDNLVKLLKHPKPAARSAACTQLARLGADASAALPELEKVAKSDKVKKVRDRAQEAITKIKGG